MVLVVVAVGVWNFSTKFQTQSTDRCRSVISWRKSKPARSKRSPSPARKSTASIGPIKKHSTRTRRPSTKGLANKLIEQGVLVTAKEPTQSPWASAAVFVGADPAPDRLLDLLHAPDAERRQQGAVVRQEQGEALVELAEEGDLQGRRRRGRGQGRAPGDHRVPEGTAEVPEARRPHSEGRALDGPPGHRQDAAGPRRGRRSQRAVLLDQRLGLRRDVRRRRRLARARPVRAGQEKRARASSSSTKSMRSAVIAAPVSAAGTTSASRR